MPVSFQIQRLASYERYFQDLLCETPSDHPDLDDVHKARDKAHEVSRDTRLPGLCALFAFVFTAEDVSRALGVTIVIQSSGEPKWAKVRRAECIPLHLGR